MHGHYSDLNTHEARANKTTSCFQCKYRLLLFFPPHPPGIQSLLRKDSSLHRHGRQHHFHTCHTHPHFHLSFSGCDHPGIPSWDNLPWAADLGQWYLVLGAILSPASHSYPSEEQDSILGCVFQKPDLVYFTVEIFIRGYFAHPIINYIQRFLSSTYKTH